MSGLFKSKKVEPQVYGQSSPQADRINELWGLIKPRLEEYSKSAGKPYEGDMVAPLTELERGNLGRLSQYLDSPLASEGESFGLAKREIGRLFGDYYDPFKEGGPMEYTKNQLSKYLREELLPMTRQGAASTGGLYSSGLVRSEQGAAGDIEDQIAKYAYQAQENLRGARQAAIPTALGIGSFEADEPFQRLASTMGLAGYERTQYEQPLLSAEYSDYLRQAQELQGFLGTGTQLAGYSETALGYPGYQPSAFEKYIIPMIQAGAQVGSAVAMGSDSRFKENLKWTGEFFKGLKVYTWKWKDWAKRLVGNTPEVGVIAQEVLEVNPEAVSQDKEGWLYVNYGLL